MGNQSSTAAGSSSAHGLRTNRFSSTADGNNNPKNRLLREHKRHGVVSVKVNATTSGRRLGENQVTHIITPKGAILYGSLFNPGPIQRAIGNSSMPLLVPNELLIPDSRANKLMVTYCYGWHLVPFPEVFSRHSGTCLVVGDRNIQGQPFQIKVGDCFRLGSVGLVVSEMKIDQENEQKIDAKTLQFLKDEALAFDTNEDLAALASDEIMHHHQANQENSLRHNQSFDDDQTNRGSIDDGPTSPEHIGHGSGLTNGEKFICYMCYETHNTTEDPLIAPCECKGDTRFLHVHCLQKWYHTSAYGSHSQVVRTTGNGAPACKICGTAYKTNFKRQDGRRASILELENSGPYLSLVVVTHHDTNPGLFNTKFRLNFGRRNGISAAVSDNDLNTIVIGRSSSCAMILDYRTVSTVHAKITHQNGKFYLSDNRSSNGTMVYIREPLPLPFSQQIKVRMGRTTLTLQAKRSWTASMRSFMFGSQEQDELNNEIAIANANGFPTPNDLMTLLSNINNLPPEKSSGNNAENDNNGPNGTVPNFLAHRSYTIRTINEGSLDGVDYDGNLENLQRFNEFGFGPDRFFADINDLRALNNFNNNIGGEIRRSGSNSSPGAISSTGNSNHNALIHNNNNNSSPGSEEGFIRNRSANNLLVNNGNNAPTDNENIHSRIFLNNNLSPKGSSRRLNNSSSNSNLQQEASNNNNSPNSEGNNVFFPIQNANNDTPPPNFIDSPDNNYTTKANTSSHNSGRSMINDEDLSSNRYPSMKTSMKDNTVSEGSGKINGKEESTSQKDTINIRSNLVLAKDLTEPMLNEQIMDDSEEGSYLKGGSGVISSSAQRDRPGTASTIVVGNHVDGNEVNNNDNRTSSGTNSGGLSPKELNVEAATTLPVSMAFTNPNHHSSTRKGSNSSLSTMHSNINEGGNNNTASTTMLNTVNVQSLVQKVDEKEER